MKKYLLDVVIRRAVPPVGINTFMEEAKREYRTDAKERGLEIVRGPFTESQRNLFSGNFDVYVRALVKYQRKDGTDEPPTAPTSEGNGQGHTVA